MVQVLDKFREGNVNQTREGRQLRPAERGMNRVAKRGAGMETGMRAERRAGMEKGDKGMVGQKVGEGKIKRVAGRRGIVGRAKSMLERKVGGKKPKPKIHFFEIIAMFSILAIADIFDWFSLTGAGIVFSWAIDVLATGGLSALLLVKRRKVGWSVAMGILEMAPFAELIILRSFAFLVFIIIDRRRNKKLLKS
jgi:hypothetical protein